MPIFGFLFFLSFFFFFGNLLLCLSAKVNVDLEHFPLDLLPVIKMENNSKREQGEGDEAASTAADNRKAPPLEAGSALIAEDFALLLSFSLSRHAQNFANKFKSKQGMGTQRSASQREGEWRSGAALRPQMAKRVRSGFRFSNALRKAKQSKVNNFANYAKANRQKVNINIHLAGVQERREGEGYAAAGC